MNEISANRSMALQTGMMIKCSPSAGLALIIILLAILAVPSRGQTVTALVTFNSENGSAPLSSLVQGTDGNLYGTTETGGNTSCNPPYGCGTIFRVTPEGTLTTLHKFCAQLNCADGATPFTGLVLGTDGNFYGGTAGGGAHACKGNVSCGGTIFKLTSQGKLTILYSFCAQENCTDGETPSALIEASDGDFYGTGGGGAYGLGTVFKVTPQGKLTVLYSFCGQSLCADGANPRAGLLRGPDGYLYGSTNGGGAFGYGTIFKVAPGGILTPLHSFDSTDGANPTAALIQGSNGGFYGSTQWGGTVINDCAFGCGTLFRISSSGKLKTLDSFDWSNGYEPYSSMIQATDGNFYGTTAEGVGGGTIFEITSSGSLTTLYTFYGGSTGIFPFGGLLQATNGTFYGTTSGDGFSFGTVYSMSVNLGPFVALVQPEGNVGAAAQIIGQGFINTTSVAFSGIHATSFKVVSDTYMTAVVPQGATTGPVVVTTPTAVLTSNVDFRVIK
jgi:uncharacterized repeat protein (TIGR03803 family)